MWWSNWSPQERQDFVRSLNAVDRVLVAGYRLLLGLAVVAVLAVVALVVVRRPWGNGNQGEWFYFSLGVLLVLGWVAGQFFKLHRRQQRRELLAAIQPSATLHTSTTPNKRGGWKWEFRFGAAPAPSEKSSSTGGDVTSWTFSRDVQIPLASLPADVLPNPSALACLEAELRRGTPLDDACTLVQPAFVSWNRPQRDAYRQYVTDQLNLRNGA